MFSGKTTIKPTAKFCLTANNAEGRQNAHDQSRLNKTRHTSSCMCISCTQSPESLTYVSSSGLMSLKEAHPAG
ncbi:hypothetical protein CBW52_17045 [Yersinia kristensenii]|uniref:Uncharacterized protein n=1 Tax=Yersinia kristensenii TaxID=28152 RepID=A0AB73Q261_YERKR|nr:hypothetical protein CBW52_17045 [Yersinia kristensenii]